MGSERPASTDAPRESGRLDKLVAERFVLVTLALAAFLASAIAVVNARVDFYGVFGGRGQERTVVSNERFTKYVHAFRYIPENFDALLIGSSISEDLDTSQIHGHRMYNASIPSASITEEALIADLALERGRFGLVVVCFDPNLFISHGRKAGGMSPGDYYSSLGSMQLFRDYVGAAGIRFGVLPNRFTPFGVKYREQPKVPIDGDALIAVDQKKLGPAGFQVDPEAVTEFAALLSRVRAHGARIVAYFPPVYAPRYAALHYDVFEAPARSLLLPGDRLLDFNDGSFAEVVRDKKSFVDGVHLSNAVSTLVAKELDHAINELPPSGAPPRAP